MNGRLESITFHSLGLGRSVVWVYSSMIGEVVHVCMIESELRALGSGLLMVT